MRCLMWFREDLRLQDNTALYHASHAAKDGLIAIYIIDTEAWQQHDTAACRIDFILRNLICLQADLEKLNIPLLLLQTTKTKKTSQLLLEIMQHYQITRLYFNQQYEIDEMRRDKAIDKLLRNNDLQTRSYTDQVWFEPGSILTKKGNCYTVFTPFKKAYLKKLAGTGNTVLAAPKKQKQLTWANDCSNNLSLEKLSQKIISKLFATKDLQQLNFQQHYWPAGELHAQQRLKDFVKHRIKNYAMNRDFPALNGTSTLSPYLATGVISSRQCLRAAMLANQGYFDRGDANILTWISELIWREFYKHILHNFPRVSMHRPFKLETEQLVWSNNKVHFQAWCDGQTGYPIVDAAMRQLKQIGWMHNRLRMIVAMFLTKDLWIDWHWGEKYFMQHLIDGDLAANNGGWQWSASTGTDASPYFRIFNPIAQSKKFDPEGEFIKSYCPELIELQGDQLHNPNLISKSLRHKINYPTPIVDRQQTKIRVLTAFKALKNYRTI